MNKLHRKAIEQQKDQIFKRIIWKITLKIYAKRNFLPFGGFFLHLPVEERSNNNMK